MRDLLQDNIIYLMNEKPDIFSKLEEYLNGTVRSKNCKLMWENNNPNLSYIYDGKEYKLYDLQTDEIQKWSGQFEDLEKGNQDIAIVGFGLGHHLVELIEKSDSNIFYILEPSIDVFLESLKVINISVLIEHPQVRYFNIGDTEEEITNFIYVKNLYKKDNCPTTYLPYYGTIMNQLLKRVYEIDYDMQINDIAAESFEVRFHSLPFQNAIRNIEYMVKSSSLKALYNKFEGCTAIVVGGGPSLEKDIELIKKYRDSILVIAAGSTVQSLIHYNIVPHFVVSMDPSEINSRVFKNVDTTDIPLVFTGQLNYEILQLHPINNFHAHFNTEQITKYVFRDVELEPVFVPNPTVSGTAIQVASYLGAKKILLTGQDFSFPNNQYYSPGVQHHTNEQISNMLNQAHMEVENVNGGKNQTNFSMQYTLQNIEALISLVVQENKIEIVNCSSLGAVIQDAPFKPLLEELKGLEEPKYDFTIVQQVLNQPIQNKFPIEYTKYAISQVIEELSLLITECQQSLKLISKIDVLCRKQPNKAMNLLADLENSFGIVTEHGIFQHFIEVWNRTLTRQYDKRVIEIEKEPAIIGKSRLLNDIVKPYIDVITKSLKDIKEEFTELEKNLSKE